MSLINYVEPISLGSFFSGIGLLVTSLVVAYIIYRVFKPIYTWLERRYVHDEKYWIVEEKMLDKVASKKGINLDEEILKRNILEKPEKNFRKKIEEEIFEEMFGKKEK